MIRTIIPTLILSFCATKAFAENYAACKDTTWALQILGSGGPELSDGRAGSSYLIWHKGKARLLIDAGGGAALRFEQSGAALNDLQAILFSHFHSDHSADLPHFAKAMYFSRRQHPLPVYGPKGSARFPSTEQFMQRLFGTDGAFSYLSDMLPPTKPGTFQFLPVSADGGTIDLAPFTLTAFNVDHGPVPALSWRIELGGYRLLLTGDFSGAAPLTKGQYTEVVLVHHAVPEQTDRVARSLHATPSEIGILAAETRTHLLLLSHRMRRTLGKEADSEAIIRQHYQGPLVFVEDMDCIPLPAQKK